MKIFFGFSNYILAIIFMTAFIAKCLALKNFIVSIRLSKPGFIFNKYPKLIAFLVLTLELMFAIGYSLKYHIKLINISVMITMIFFCIYIYINKDQECRCFGQNYRKQGYFSSIFRNLLIFLCCLLNVLFYQNMSRESAKSLYIIISVSLVSQIISERNRIPKVNHGHF